MPGSTAIGGVFFCIASPSPVPGGTIIAPAAGGSVGALGPVCANADVRNPAKSVSENSLMTGVRALIFDRPPDAAVKL